MARLQIGGFVTEFVTGFPDIAVPLDVDIATLEAGDGAPFFVTLPIIPEVGTVSANGLLYDDDLAASIEEQINSKRPGANFGHLPETEREVAFPHPKAFWVAALRVGQTLWAKCYVPAGEAREHLRNLRAVGGKIATSIFGRGDFEKVRKGVQRLVNFELETVDFAPPERSALGYAAPVIVTAEMDNEQSDSEGDNEMADVIEVTLAAVPEPVRQQIIAEYEQNSERTRQVSELTEARDSAVAELTTLRGQVREMAVVEMRRTIKSRVAEYTDWPIQNESAKAEVEAFRRTVCEFVEGILGENPDIAKADATVDTAWARMKPVAEYLRDKLAGPPAVVSSRVRETNGVKPIEDTPAAREAAMSQMGITV